MAPNIGTAPSGSLFSVLDLVPETQLTETEIIEHLHHVSEVGYNTFWRLTVSGSAVIPVSTGMIRGQWLVYNHITP